MGRRRNFSREDVLSKAIPVFWKRGFADTKLEDLEEATGVNKSGLYSEFSSKEDFCREPQALLKGARWQRFAKGTTRLAQHQKFAKKILSSRERRRLFCDLLHQGVIYCS